MTTMADREQSVAFKALGKNAKRVYAFVVSEIEVGGGGSVPITTALMMERLNIASSSAISAAIRELRALGFVEVQLNARRANAFSVSERWRAITDGDDAKRLVADARAAKQVRTMRTCRTTERKGPKVNEVQAARERSREAAAREEEPSRKPITLFDLGWPSERGLQLLAE